MQLALFVKMLVFTRKYFLSRPSTSLLLFVFLSVFFSCELLRALSTLCNLRPSFRYASTHSDMKGKLDDLCEKELCVQPYRNVSWRTMMTYAPEYGLANCAIPKSLSTVSMAIMCYLFDPLIYDVNNRTLTDGNWINRLCIKKNEAELPNDDQLISPNWKHFAIIRDPIDRLISGFVSKCINDPVGPKTKILKDGKDKNWCYGCKNNISCFIYSIYEKMALIAEAPPHVFLENHFYPQNWFCTFLVHLDKYQLLVYSTEKNKMIKFVDELTKIFSQKNVPEHLIQTIKRQLLEKKTKHATSGTESANFYRNWIFNDANLLHTVLKTYYYDYIIFGFDFPAEYFGLMNVNDRIPRLNE